MSEYKNKILRVKAEFIDFLKKDLETRSYKKVDQNEIRTIVYEFIQKRVFAQIKGGKKEISKLVYEMSYKTIDFCLSYGFVIIETLAKLKECQDIALEIEKQEVSEEVDA